MKPSKKNCKIKSTAVSKNSAAK